MHDTVTTAAGDHQVDQATRRWRLRGYNREKKLAHQSTHTGDRALDHALRRLEHNDTIVRIAVDRA